MLVQVGATVQPPEAWGTPAATCRHTAGHTRVQLPHPQGRGLAGMGYWDRPRTGHRHETLDLFLDIYFRFVCFDCHVYFGGYARFGYYIRHFHSDYCVHSLF